MKRGKNNKARLGANLTNYSYGENVYHEEKEKLNDQTNTTENA